MAINTLEVVKYYLSFAAAEFERESTIDQSPSGAEEITAGHMVSRAPDQSQYSHVYIPLMAISELRLFIRLSFRSYMSQIYPNLI